MILDKTILESATPQVREFFGVHHSVSMILHNMAEAVDEHEYWSWEYQSFRRITFRYRNSVVHQLKDYLVVIYQLSLSNVNIGK